MTSLRQVLLRHALMSLSPKEVIHELRVPGSDYAHKLLTSRHVHVRFLQIAMQSRSKSDGRWADLVAALNGDDHDVLFVRKIKTSLMCREMLEFLFMFPESYLVTCYRLIPGVPAIVGALTGREVALRLIEGKRYAAEKRQLAHERGTGCRDVP